MTYWYTIQDMADRATIETNKLVTAKDVFKLAEQGVVRVGAVTGDNELQWHYQDGSIVEKSNVTTDGVARWLDTAMLDRLAVHGQVKIAGLQWPISGSTTLTAGPDSPFVKMDDLRVPESEYSRLLSAINGKSVAPRELEGTAPTPKRLAAEPGAHLIRQWQDLAERIVKLRESESNIPPSEQEAAIRLRNGFEGERRQLEAKPEFLSALDSYLTRLEATHEGIARSGQQALIEQSAARIESWSEHLARLRMAQVNEHEREPEQTNDEIDTTGMVAWQAVTLENWPEIVKTHAGKEKQSPADVMKWLKKCGPRDVIPAEQPNQFALVWMDQYRNKHTVQKSTIGNCLSEWRKTGIIPC